MVISWLGVVRSHVWKFLLLFTFLLSLIWFLFQITSRYFQSIRDSPWVVLARTWSQGCFILDMVKVTDSIVNFNFPLFEFFSLLIQLLQRFNNIVLAWSRFFLLLLFCHQCFNVCNFFGFNVLDFTLLRPFIFLGVLTWARVIFMHVRLIV